MKLIGQTTANPPDFLNIDANASWVATWAAVRGNGWDAEHPELGNNWENQALFDFDDKALPAMKLFSCH